MSNGRKRILLPTPLNNVVHLTSNKPMEDTIPYRWSRFVKRRAISITVWATLLLLFVAIPVISIQLGFADAWNDPEGTTTRRAYDMFEEGFGPDANGPLILVTELNDDSSLIKIQTVIATLQQAEGFAHVSPGIPNDPQQPTAVWWQVYRQHPFRMRQPATFSTPCVTLLSRRSRRRRDRHNDHRSCRRQR